MSRPRARRRWPCGGVGAENLSFTFTNRNVAMPYTPVGVFLIDQWRQIGVTVEHEQLETRLYTDKLLSDELQAGLDYACDFMDEPSIQLIKYISADKSTINYTGSMDEKLDQLYEQQARSSTRRSATESSASSSSIS